jgi:hypothetical protein
MFPLFTATLPSSAADLERLLNESLQRIFVTESDPVIVREHSYPHLEAISISLDGARLRADPPQPPVISGKTSPGLEISQFTLSASPLLLGPAAVELSLSARRLQLWQGKDFNDQIVLTLQSAADGKVDISATQTDLEALASKLARDQGSKQGIKIDGVQLKLLQKSARSLAVEVRLLARKLFLSASIRVTAQLDLDDQLNLRISGLNCTGDGGEFPLMSLPLGGIRLRDVRLVVDDRLSVTAEFGSAI